MKAPMERPPGRTGGRGSWAGGPTDSTHDTRQLTLDDAHMARDGGLVVATYATDVAWREACDQTIRELATTGRPFTAEDVRAVCGPPVAASPNALGARFMAASRAGVIVPAGWTQATRVEAHGRGLRRWVGT